eukprot:TRINITY_DN15762_c0_g2_i1.p1 TRINITY_DN15762_c0_g2~~TRINITY_DN15762_c0_g2_i1.p1  ORF type:complete len:347 (-),score=40.36 TRINITY_DN15762_c0_g2_i1:192-1232(-)
MTSPENEWSPRQRLTLRSLRDGGMLEFKRPTSAPPARVPSRRDPAQRHLRSTLTAKVRYGPSMLVTTYKRSFRERGQYGTSDLACGATLAKHAAPSGDEGVQRLELSSSRRELQAAETGGAEAEDEGRPDPYMRPATVCCGRIAPAADDESSDDDRVPARAQLKRRAATPRMPERPILPLGPPPTDNRRPANALSSRTPRGVPQSSPRGYAPLSARTPRAQRRSGKSAGASAAAMRRAQAQAHAEARARAESQQRPSTAAGWHDSMSREAGSARGSPSVRRPSARRPKHADDAAADGDGPRPASAPTVGRVSNAYKIGTQSQLWPDCVFFPGVLKSSHTATSTSEL